MIAFTEAQATALVTDPGTLKRGRELAGLAKWGNLGRTATAAWGECAGSGSRPYLTGIDLTEPAFKCSCPSRVFPCKHGAGLLLLLARQPALLPAGSPPAWLAEWLEKRQAKGDEQAARTATKTAKKAPAAAPPNALPDAATTPLPTAAAQQKREAQRHARMQAGAADLETWLLDLLRAGLADLEKKPASFWESQAARLVDNQLPGLAAVLRELAEYPTAGAQWAPRLLARLGELYVLVRAFLNRDNLAPAARQEVWQQVGLTPKKDDLLADPSALVIADTWLVLGQHVWPEERVTGRRSWLLGQNSGRMALVLEFAFGSQPFATALVPQGRYAGELVFYPGLLPLRAAPVGLVYQGSAAEAVPPGQSISQLLDGYATALASQPWLRQWPATLAEVLPTPLPGGGWLLHHATEPLTLPLHAANEATDLWQLLAGTGGQPVTIFGEWDGQVFRLLGSWPGAQAGTLSPVPAATPAAQEMTALVAQDSSPAAPATVEPPAPADVPAWPQLLRLALLGTRQSAAVLPASAVVSAAASREQQLLLAAGTVALLHKAGYVPLTAAAVPPPPAPAPPETAAYLGPLGTACLRELLTSSLYAVFGTDFITAIQAHQRLVPPALLVPVLSHDRFQLHLPGAAATILGERGRWLAQLNPAWQAMAAAVHPSRDLATWDTGSLHERRFFIRLLHEADPAQARQLLTATLPTEPAASQAALLSELTYTAAADDAPLLTSYLTSKSKEVRQTVVPMLVRLPGSPLAERLWQRAAPLLAVQPTSRGRPELRISLPTGWDKSWLADGIEQRTTSFDGGERAGWLGQLLALLPPSRWLTHLGLATADELLALAEATEWAALLLAAWASATYLHHDKAFAEPLLLRHFARPGLLHHQQVTHLTWLLTEEEKLALLRRQLPPPAATEWPAAVPALLGYLFLPWPADVVEAALRYLADVLAPAVMAYQPEAAKRLSTLLYRLARYVPGNQADTCLETLQLVASAYPFTATYLTDFAELLRFRQRLDASWLESA